MQVSCSNFVRGVATRRGALTTQFIDFRRDEDLSASKTESGAPATSTKRLTQEGLRSLDANEIRKGDLNYMHEQASTIRDN